MLETVYRRVPRGLLALLLIGLSGCSADGPTQPVEEVLEVSPSAVTFTFLGEEVQLEAVLRPQDPFHPQPSTITWATTDSTVVTVTSDGLARAGGNGTASIVVSSGRLASVVDVVVAQVAAFMTLSADSMALAGPGDRRAIEASVVDAGGSPLTSPEVLWSSDDESVATVDSTGVVTAMASGEVTITAEVTGGERSLEQSLPIRVGESVLVGTGPATVLAPRHPVSLSLGSGALSEPAFLAFGPATGLPDRPVPVPGTAVQISPVDLEFSGPVTLTIGYDEGELPDGVSEEELALYELIGEDYVAVEAGSVDVDGNTVSGVIDGLGVFAVLQRLSVQTTSLSYGVVGAEYGVETLSAVSGTGDYWWSLAGGSGPPPPGLTLFADGTISGVPTAQGIWPFVVEVRSGGQIARQPLTITVDEILDLTTVSLPDAAPTVTYSAALEALGGSGEYSWSLAAGSDLLPPGLSLSADGIISGIPTQDGSWGFVVEVESRGQTAQRSLSIRVTPPLMLTTASLPAGVETVAYSESLSATGGAGAYTWSLASDSDPLPPGLTLSSEGSLAGVPTTDGEWTFAVEVSSGDGQLTGRALSIVIHELLSVSTTELSRGAPGVAYFESLEAVGGEGGYTWRLASGSGALPAGLALSGEGTISGTPTRDGTRSFAVEVESGDGQTAGRTLSITINSALQVTTADLPNGAPTVDYSETLNATGGDGSYAWRLASGSGPLPPGLTLSSGGTVSGTPTQNGTWTFTVEVASGDGQKAQRSLTVTMQAPTAAFTVSCTDLTCSFTDRSSDDGSVVAWSWTFGDGSSSDQRHPSYSYSAGGTYTVRLTVTDDLGAASAPAQRGVTVFAPPVLVGAGDVAVCTGSGDEATAALLDGISGTIFTTGDNAYPNGTASDFQNCYDPSWGRHKARTRPSAGNHDYDTPGAAAYYAYFGSRAGDASKGYYAYDLGAWRIVVLNSNLQTNAGSPQLQWLAADLAANPRTCTLAYWHHARFSSGTHGNNPAMKPFWDALYAAGVDVVLVGHDHDYERFAPQDPNGAADPVNGIRQFVVGTGGSTLRGFPTIAANSEVRYSSSWGVLKLTLYSSRYEWRFVPTAGSGFSDTGSASCH